jgi:predicted MFS family arabinose efflux permease
VIEGSTVVLSRFPSHTLEDAKRTPELASCRPGTHFTGIALGPALAGLGIEHYGFAALPVVSGLALLLYAACILPFARQASVAKGADNG